MIDDNIVREVALVFINEENTNFFTVHGATTFSFMKNVMVLQNL